MASPPGPVEGAWVRTGGSRLDGDRLFAVYWGRNDREPRQPRFAFAWRDPEAGRRFPTPEPGLPETRKRQQ